MEKESNPVSEKMGIMTTDKLIEMVWQSSMGFDHKKQNTDKGKKDTWTSRDLMPGPTSDCDRDEPNGVSLNSSFP